MNYVEEVLLIEDDVEVDANIVLRHNAIRDMRHDLAQQGWKYVKENLRGDLWNLVTTTQSMEMNRTLMDVLGKSEFRGSDSGGLTWWLDAPYRVSGDLLRRWHRHIVIRPELWQHLTIQPRKVRLRRGAGAHTV